MNPIAPVQNTNVIRMADFVRITQPAPADPLLFSNASTPITVSGIGTFDGLNTLMGISDVQRDIKSTANETTILLNGVDTSLLGYVLGERIKGLLVEAWHGFFDANGQLITTGGTGGLYKFLTGQINSYQITEVFNQGLQSYFGQISVSVSSIQLILQNRISGRYTNNASWTFFNPNDTSMNRIATLSTLNYQFGKGAPAGS